MLSSPFGNIFNVKFLSVFILGLAVLTSALGAIFCQHQSRMLHANLQNLNNESNYLVSEWRQLLLDYSAWTTDSRVEQIAKNNLDMVVIKNTKVIKP